MIVDDLDILRTCLRPDETQTPLSIDADAVLPDAVVLQRFELIAWWRAQKLERMRRIELGQLADSRILDRSKLSWMTALVQGPRILAAKAPDHRRSVLRRA